MSFYDDASLVLIPSGIKTSKVYSQKPTDGSGDFTFSRASIATRTNSAGLIEKVRTNFIRNSSMVGAVAGTPGTLPTNWGTSPFAFAGLTRTVIGVGSENGLPYVDVRINGTATGTAASIFTEATTPASPSQVFANSVYLKYIANPNPALSVQLATNFFNGTTFVNSQITTIVPTNDLTRFVGIHTASSSTLNLATTLISFGFVIASTYDFTIRIAAPQMELGDAASDWIPTTTAAVTVGPTNNVPRLDYMTATGALSTCPMLEAEQQRTNSCLWSEQMNNWAAADTTVTTNVLVSPDGYQNADTIVINDSLSRVSQNLSLGAGTYTASVYAKLTSGSGEVRINLNVDGVFSSFVFTPTTEWVRYTYTVTAATGITSIQLRGFSGTPTVAFWGAQIEVGSFVSTYIPTTTAAVTRLKDDIAISGASALIGQTEGTIFLDVDFRSVSLGSIRVFFALEGSVGNQFSGVQVGTTNNGNNVQYAGTIYTLTQGRHKIVCTYNSTTNQSKLFVDGAQRGATGTSPAFLATIDRISVLGRPNPFSGFAVDRQIFGGCNQFVVFKTALSDAQCIELSTL